ncbi:hypothetical protein [Chitinimonas sp.]|uniref:hypothetical protein n=1 Tax=Chitinimonas sp. TaxID=1934313 RepID=UPI002F952AA2
MEIKSLIPIAGVLIGWLLSQVSGSFSLAREDRRSRASALPAMIDLYVQQYRINKILEIFNQRLTKALEELHKHRESGNLTKNDGDKIIRSIFSTFEIQRQGNIDLPEKQKEALFLSLANAVDSLSKVTPTLAYRLSKLTSEFILFQEIKFPEKDLDLKNYLETYSHILGVFRSDLGELRRLIIRAALGIGVIQFFGILSLLKSEEKELNNVSPEIIETALQSIKPSPIENGEK